MTGTAPPSTSTAAATAAAISSSASGGGSGTPMRRSSRSPPAAGSPLSTVHNKARSSALRASAPALSIDGASGRMPSIGSAPWRAFNPLTPQNAAGRRIEPAVSVPSAANAAPVATATAEPPLEPPALRSGSHGLAAAGVVTPKASSCVAVLPITTAPASRSRVTSGASRGGRIGVRDRGAAAGRQARDVDDVLDGDRDAVQRPARAALGERGRLPARALVIEQRERPERARGLGPREARLGQLDHAELAPAQRVRRLDQRQLERISTRAHSSCASFCTVARDSRSRPYRYP